MDIIAAHQHGLIEQLDEEVAALAGRVHDHGQRAVVLHHLYDHSRGRFGWALAEARQELRIASGIAALRRRLDRWGWTIARRDRAREALDRLAEAFGQAGTGRTAAAYRAYRLSATAALRAEAEMQLPPALLDALERCHRARRLGEADTGDSLLDEECERLAGGSVEPAVLAAAWAAIDATGLRRIARRLLGEKALARRRAADERRGWCKIERQLRGDMALPAAFRANPAQHFYALQQMLRDRRRQQWREECDREPDAFGLAA